jgi:hypothetical protein
MLERRWRYGEGRVDLEDDPRIGRQAVNRDLCTIEKIRELAARKRRITLKLTVICICIWRQFVSYSVKHSLTDNHKGSQRDSVGRLRLDLSDHSALPQLHLYWRRVMNVSIASWNETSVHAVENKRITEPQFCLQNSKIKWILCTLIHKQSVNQKEFDVGRKQGKVNSTYRCWKSYWSAFR